MDGESVDAGAVWGREGESGIVRKGVLLKMEAREKWRRRKVVIEGRGRDGWVGCCLYWRREGGKWEGEEGSLVKVEEGKL